MGAAALPVALGTSILGTGASAYGQYQAGKAESSYYRYLAGNSRLNASLATASADANVEAIGAEAGYEGGQLIKKGQGVVGAQTAAMAANGVTSGRTRQDVIKDTLMKSEMDIEALNYNAGLAAKNARVKGKMDAFNYMNQARGYDIAGANAKQAGKVGAFTTILGGAGSVSRDWLMMG